MLPKERRICLKRDFEHIFSSGRSINGKLFRLKFLKNSLSLNRFAVVVSSKVSKKAVIRNRVRRRAWATIAAMDSGFKNNLDVVLIALKEASQADFPMIRSEISFFINKRLS